MSQQYICTWKGTFSHFNLNDKLCVALLVFLLSVFLFYLNLLYSFSIFPPPSPVSPFFFTVTFCPPSLTFTHFGASSFSHTRPQSTHTHSHMHAHTHAHPPSLFGCLCSTGSKSLVAACSSPNLPSLCTIALGTKLRPHNSRPARVNSRANTVKAKTHFLLSPTSPAKN